MFCTSKEQESCEVEKRGCKGCYYNGMSEEEIIEIVKSIAENAEVYDAITDDGIRAIKRIL